MHRRIAACYVVSGPDAAAGCADMSRRKPAPMAADIVNLNKARKAKARAEKEAKAVENRVKFGRSKAQRNKDQADAERRRRELDGAKLTADAEPSTDLSGSDEAS